MEGEREQYHYHVLYYESQVFQAHPAKANKYSQYLEETA
jgi:hypothetical protein